MKDVQGLRKCSLIRDEVHFFFSLWMQPNKNINVLCVVFKYQIYDLNCTPVGLLLNLLGCNVFKRQRRVLNERIIVTEEEIGIICNSEAKPSVNTAYLNKITSISICSYSCVSNRF